MKGYAQSADGPVFKSRRTVPSTLWLLLVLATILACGPDDGDDPGDDQPPGDPPECEVFTDHTTELIWQNTVGPLRTWPDAKAYCDGLTYCSRTDWRLPTISELRSLIRGCDSTELGGSCGVTEACDTDACWDAEDCSGCSDSWGPYGGPGVNGFYWDPEVVGTMHPYWTRWICPGCGDDGDVWTVAFQWGGIMKGRGDSDPRNANQTRCVTSF